jgi:hypothetical protein
MKEQQAMSEIPSLVKGQTEEKETQGNKCRRDIRRSKME